MTQTTPSPTLRETTPRRAVSRRSTDSRTTYQAKKSRRFHRVASNTAKRTFDIGFVVLTAPLWAPCIALLAAAVRCTSRGPAFYTHERVGRHGVPFPCTKLRTMVRDADDVLDRLLVESPDLRHEYSDCFKLRDDPRVTRLGRVLRCTGLDELPQLVAVLRGEMSLVGPRPIVAAETTYFGPDLFVVQSVRPGLTGLWQVSGRSNTTYQERVDLDLQYARSHTLRTDITIIRRTLTAMMRPSNSGGY